MLAMKEYASAARKASRVLIGLTWVLVALTVAIVGLTIFLAIEAAVG
jgi:hypothetical protein